MVSAKKKGDKQVINRLPPFVRVEGLEPPCLAAPDPKSGGNWFLTV